MTSITLKDQYSEVTITVDGDDITINELIENLIEPAVMALGYQTRHGEIKYEPFEEKE